MVVETGATEKGVMATEAMGATTGALVAAVATEVEDIHPVATETTGKSFYRARSLNRSHCLGY